MEKYIKNILAERKINAEKKADSALNNALKDSTFKKLYSEYNEQIINKAKSEVYNTAFDNKNLEKIENNLKNRLKELNINYNDFTPHYHCNKCKDTGIFENQECECVNQIKSNELLKRCGLNFKPHSFEDSKFDIFDNPSLLKNLYTAMKKWCQTTTEVKNIIISGNSGVGKSFLLECMLTELLKEKKYVLYTTAFSLSQDLLKYHTTFDSSKEEIISPYLKCDILIIDDLGTEPIFKNVNEEYLYLILNQRVFEKKPILISTNLTLPEIQERYGERILSRLINKNLSKLFRIENTDLRLKKF